MAVPYEILRQKKRPKLLFYNTFTILEDVTFRLKSEGLTAGRTTSTLSEDS